MNLPSSAGATGTPAAHSTSTTSVTRRWLHHSARCLSISSRAARRPSSECSVESIAQSGRPNAADERLPLVVVLDRHRDPRVLQAVVVDVAGAVEVLRGGNGAVVAVPLDEVAVRAPFDDLLRGDVQRATDHRHLDLHAPAGAPAVFEREQQREASRASRRRDRTSRSAGAAVRPGNR